MSAMTIKESSSSLYMLPFFLTSVAVLRMIFKVRHNGWEIVERRYRMRVGSGSGSIQSNSTHGDGRITTSSDKELRMMKTPTRSNIKRAYPEKCEGTVQLTTSIDEEDTKATAPLSPLRNEGKSLGLKVVEDRTNDDSEFHFLTPVSSSIRLAAPIVNRIDHAKEIIVIGIAGGSGSGKTTLARAIYETIGAENITLLSHDSYYKDLGHLSFDERERQNFDHPNALDTDLLIEHVNALRNMKEVTVPTYDYSTHTRKKEGWRQLAPRPVIMVEGILIFCRPELTDLIDIKIFVDTDDDIRLIRRVQRDTIDRGRSLDGIIQQYVSTVRPMHLTFVEPSKRNADLIVPVGLNSVALDLVVSKLKSHLNEQAAFRL